MSCGSPKIKRTIGVVEAFALLTAAITAKGGGFFYEKESESGGCRYRNADNPDMRCIVGEGFFRQYGIEEMHCAGSIITGDVQRYLDTKHDILLTREAAVLLQAAQRTQDRGETWGNALAAAVEQHYGIRKIVHDADYDVYQPVLNV